MSYMILCGTDRDDAEDAVQYAFVQLFHQWQTVHAPSAWLRKVAFRKALQMQARNERPLEPGYDGAGGQPASERIELNEEAEAVLAALSRLPITQRKVVALHYDEYGINEIGEMLGMTAAAVRQNLSRARRRLRDQLGSRPACPGQPTSCLRRRPAPRTDPWLMPTGPPSLRRTADVLLVIRHVYQHLA